MEATQPHEATSAHRTEVRQDIQVLRGIAVLAVLLYHSKLVPVAGGYLGVDIFFVISGFLITKNILTDIARQRFSFLDFYSRRARRLLPAAYCTLVVTTLLASRVLTEDRWSDYIDQLMGAVTFTANIVLPMQTGYFETAAETKPLLHTWSLSVEEQYYLLAPLLLWLLRPHWRLPALSLLAVLSLGLCVALVSTRFTYWRLPDLDSQQVAFFMLPARAWEMLAGSLLACQALRGIRFELPRSAKLVALVLLCALCAHPLDTMHPRGDAIAAVLLTALLIAGSGRWLGGSAPVRAVAKVGDLSYSLYLVHWPLFALAESAFLGQVPPAARASLVALSLMLAYLQNRYVEQRFRYHRAATPGLGLRWLAGGSLAVVALPHALASWRTDAAMDTYAYLRLPNRGLSVECGRGAGVTKPQTCSTSPHPRIVVWGDSYAMHLLPGLRKLDLVDPSLMQLTKSSCAPVRGIASIDATFDAIWAAGCLTFNEKAFHLIAHSDSVRYVIMSSPFSGYLDQGDLTMFHRGRQRTADRTIVLDELTDTIRGLQAYGKIPILVAPPPSPGFNIGACHEQRGSGLVVLGRESCDFALTEHLRNRRGIVDGLKEIGRRTGVAVVWLDGPICVQGRCKTAMPDGVSIYKDGGHLTAAASEWLIPQVGIEKLVQGPK